MSDQHTKPTRKKARRLKANKDARKRLADLARGVQKDVIEHERLNALGLVRATPRDLLVGPQVPS